MKRRKSPPETIATPSATVLPAASDLTHCAVVAIGASVGGLEAFQQFFLNLPDDTGMAFVLVQHLDPNHETLIPELLAKYTGMPVLPAEDGVELRANHVFVIRPNTVLGVESCALRVTPVLHAGGEKMPIDHFFRSVAEAQTSRVIGIVLTGNGADGTLGLREIKAQGGMTMAQAPAGAKYPAMPRNAVLAGVVDHVLPVEAMPAKILEYAQHLKQAQRRVVADEIAHTTRHLEQILPLLHRRTGHDFSRYKHSTLVRRILRRMQVLYIESPKAYVEHLRSTPAEIDELFKDLLIGVTQFFRDPDAFDRVAREVIPTIFRKRSTDRPIRVWVPACASGEEAYSIAILCAEHIASAGLNTTAQIFATDLDEDALEFARKGRYPESIAEQVSAERLERYFVSRGSGYEVGEQLRNMCVFSPHNLIKDPPFSRLDLISCRNLLIYFEADLQKKLLPLFHYALNPSGFLFLGPAENIASRSELFRVVDKKHRIFQRNASMLRSGTIPIIESLRTPRVSPLHAPQFHASKDQNLARTIERVVLEEYAPASVIISEEGDVMYFSGRTGKFLEPAAGVPSNKLTNMARKSLRLELRSAIHRAVSTRQEVIRKNLAIKTPAGPEPINLIVRPLTEVGKEAGLYIVVFQELVSAAPDERPADGQLREIDAEHPLVQQLESELRSTKEDLQTTIEELETSNEELKSANEELLSMNEELQSTNEELQTSKEELQSLNDELQHKVEELDGAHADLQNLFQSTQIATVFLDPELRLKRFTPAMARVLPLSERDVGRPFAQIVSGIVGDAFFTEIKGVLRRLPAQEHQVQLHPGNWYVVRASPYETLDHEVEGVVVTFTDITELKRGEEHRALLAAIVEGSEDAIIGRSREDIITSWNAAAERIYGYTAAEAIGRHSSIIVPADRADELPGIYERLEAGERVPAVETKRILKDRRTIDVSLSVSAIRDSQNRIVGFSSICRDITDRKRAEEAVVRSERLLSDFVENATEGLHWVGPDGTILWANRAELESLGYSRDEYVGHNIAEFHVDTGTITDILHRLTRGEKLDSCEARLRCKNGSIRHVIINSNVYWENGKFVHTRCFTRDITGRKLAEEKLQEERRILEVLNEVGAKLSAELDLEKLVQAATDAATQITGAQFGAFFYNVINEQGEAYTLYSLSGVPRAAFEKFPMPRNTALFGATFRGEGVIRISDVLQDPRYGRNLPHRGMPDGHLPVRSYLAAPVVARSGEVLGGLFFGHEQPGVFTERAEKIIAGIASQAAIAIDNARLYQARGRAEEALRATEQQLRAIIQATPDCVKIVAGDGMVLQMNTAGCGMLDAEDSSGVVGRNMCDLVAPEYRAEFLAMHQRVCSGLREQLEFQVVGLKGVRRWMETHAVPLHDPLRNETVQLAVTRDITRRKEAEQALRESEARFRQLADAMPQMVWTARPDGVVDYYNRRWYEYTGLPEGGTGDASWKPVLHPDDVQPCLDLWYRSVRTGEPYQIEYRFRDRTGAYRWHLGRALPIFNDAQQIERWFGTGTDIHELKETQSALRDAQKKLAEHAEDLERLVRERTADLHQTVQSLEGVCYTMAHDLRAPLRSLHSFTEILLNDYASRFDADARRYAERIFAAVKRMDMLIRDLLEFARLSHAQLPGEQLNLNEELSAVLYQLGEEIRASGAEVKVLSTLPVAIANRTMLNQVLTNLIVNALKFVAADQKPRVEITGEQAGGVARVCVRDNGIGIAPEYHERIFGLFQRLHGPDQYPGTGVGLAIVRKGLERMGGRITLHSEPNRGSTFCIELPSASA